MDPNLALIIGLAAGLAFLNIVLFGLWCFWQHERRKTRDLRRDKLAYLNHRPRKLVKRNRPSPPPQIHTLPETYDTHTCSAPIRNSEPIYLPSPYGFPQPPKQRIARPLGLSPLRNELYAPSISAESKDTASIYSTMSAPRHLHEDLLSETHSSCATVDTMDTVDTVVEKYDECPTTTTLGPESANASYFFQEDHAPPRTPESTQLHPITYQYNLHGAPPYHNAPLQQCQWSASSEATQHMCSPLPFRTLCVPIPTVPEHVLEDSAPSPLRSPHSP